MATERAKKSSKGKCRETSRDLWHLPVCQNYNWISCLVEGVKAIGLRVPRYRATEQVNFAGSWKIGIESHRQILQEHVAPHKNLGKKESIARNYAKV